MFHHLLLPIDVRFIPRKALMTAAALAAEDDADLTLLYVSDVRRDLWSAAFSLITEADMERYNENVRHALDDAAAIVSEYGATAWTRVAHGGPVHKVIATEAMTLAADVIVMGTHGRRGLARALWGSVTEDVSREVDLPVLVIHESPRTPFPRRMSRIHQT